jgi:predicted nucleic acid-binding protein
VVQEKRGLIVDANVLYSALHKPQGVCGTILQAAIDGFCELFSPDSVREEVRRNLVENLSMSEQETLRLISALPVEWVPREAYEDRINQAVSLLTHEEDAPVLAASLATRLQILSGDRHFHSEKVIRVAKVFTPRQFLESLPRRKP